VGLQLKGNGNAQTFTSTALQGNYTVWTVAGAYCPASVTAPLTIEEKVLPSITTQPAPTKTPFCNYNVNLSLSVAVNGTSGLPFSYQWQKNSSNVPGATGSSYSELISAGGSYTVEVTNKYGCKTLSSQAEVKVASAMVGTIGALGTCTAPGVIGSKVTGCSDNFNVGAIGL
jgi:hypothetical protein